MRGLQRTVRSLRESFVNDPEIYKWLLSVANGSSQTGITDSLSVVLGSLAEIERLDRAGIPRPHLYAGYSVGNFTAMYAAGMISKTDLIRIVVERGKILEQCSRKNPGRMMVSIGLSDHKIKTLASRAGFKKYKIYLTNHNAPGHWTLAGPKKSLKLAYYWLIKAGARRVVFLKTKGAWHCPLMRGAAKPFSVFIRKNTQMLKRAHFDVLDNLNGYPLPLPGKTLQRRLTRHLYTGVNWLACLRTARRMGARQFLEVGYCDILKKIGPFAVPDAQHLASAVDI